MLALFLTLVGNSGTPLGCLDVTRREYELQYWSEDSHLRKRTLDGRVNVQYTLVQPVASNDTRDIEME